jgi:hypothetical protein
MTSGDVNRRSQCRDRWCYEELPQRDFDAEEPTGAKDELSSANGIQAGLEQVVVHADRIVTDQLRRKTGEIPLSDRPGQPGSALERRSGGGGLR